MQNKKSPLRVIFIIPAKMPLHYAKPHKISKYEPCKHILGFLLIGRPSTQYVPFTKVGMFGSPKCEMRTPQQHLNYNI